MFKSWAKTKNVVTLFHRESVPNSIRVLTLLKQSNAMAGATATEDQAASHAQQDKASRGEEWELDVNEGAPTNDQVRSILEYLGGANAASKIVKGAKDESDALSKLQQSSDNLLAPITVNWGKGQVVVGDSESEIMKLVDTTVFEKK